MNNEATIKRLHGTTGVPTFTTDDVKDVIFTWAWLLPSNGLFSAKELSERIKTIYDENNPKMAADLAILATASEAEAVATLVEVNDENN